MFTIDRSTLVSDPLGATQGFTPEGYLECSGVQIARVGQMLYAPWEVPVDRGDEPMVMIERGPDVLFDPKCIASFNGKPVTLEHPDVMVAPARWKQDAFGVVLNPRRGEGAETDYLVADLLITDPAAIAAIRNGALREVSCGYDATYETVKPGLGRQTGIIGNHVALVDRARCGPACSIGDAEMATTTTVKTHKPRSLSQALLSSVWSAFHSKDEKALAKALDEAPADEDNYGEGGDIHLHVHAGEKSDDDRADESKNDGEGEKPDLAKAIGDMASAIKTIDENMMALSDRVGKLEASRDEARSEEEKKDAEEAPDDKDDRKDEGKTGDSVGLADTWRNIVSVAEIIAPGARPAKAFDAKAKFADTAASLCGFRRDVLRKASADAKARPHVESIFGPGSTFDEKDFTCRDIEIGFRAVGELVRVARNADAAARGVDPAEARASGRRPMTSSDLQAINEKKYPRPGRQSK